MKSSFLWTCDYSLCTDKNSSMKKAYPKQVRGVHSEYLSNSFITTVLFLLLLAVTAFALAGCYTDLKNPTVQTLSSKIKLSTGNRCSGLELSH
jgi:hypothetical protein